jgi:hypothetical protein
MQSGTEPTGIPLNLSALSAWESTPLAVVASGTANHVMRFIYVLGMRLILSLSLWHSENVERTIRIV